MIGSIPTLHANRVILTCNSHVWLPITIKNVYILYNCNAPFLLSTMPKTLNGSHSVVMWHLYTIATLAGSHHMHQGFKILFQTMQPGINP